MRISQLQLRNFRLFTDQTFDFAPRFNLFVGDNGAGKSSVLDGIAVAAGSWFLGIRGYDSRSIYPEEVRVVRMESAGVSNFEGQYPVEVTARGVVQGCDLQWTRSLEGLHGRTTRMKASGVKDLAARAEVEIRSGAPVVLPLISHYGAGRLWVAPKDMQGNTAQEPASGTSRLDGYQYSLDPRINFKDLFRWLQKEKYISLQEGKERVQFLVVKEAIKGCIDGCDSVDYDVREEALIVTCNGRELPFRLLSDGQKAMVAVAADIGFKASILNPQLGDRVLLETPGVVIIDELDLHLHPRWQRHVVRDLQQTFPKIQFFASSHSPSIIGETDRDSVIVLGPDQSHGRPSIARGAEAGWILEYVMGAAARSSDAKALIGAIDKDLSYDADLAALRRAREQLGLLRKLLGSDDGEIARLESTLDSLEALARAED